MNLEVTGAKLNEKSSLFFQKRPGPKLINTGLKKPDVGYCVLSPSKLSVKSYPSKNCVFIF